MVKLNTRGIPKKVLFGKVPKFRSIYFLYRSRLVQELFVLMHQAFWAKAEGGADNQGDIWEPLADSTMKYKVELQEGPLRHYSVNKQWYETSDEKKGKDNVRTLSPDQQRLYGKVYQKALRQLVSLGAKAPAIAKKKAFDAIKASDPNRPSAALIGVRTGRLAASTFPGLVLNNRYYPTADQKFIISDRKVTFDNEKVPHGVAFEQGLPRRSILPDDLNPWIQICHEKVIGEVHALYVTKQATTKQSKQKTTGSNPKQQNPRTTKRRH